MPFIEQSRREVISRRGVYSLAEPTPGDFCYDLYKTMVDKWRVSPRWTTAHTIYRDMIQCLDDADNWEFQAAYELAWQVFFQLHVMPYELEKRKENGDVY